MEAKQTQRRRRVAQGVRRKKFMQSLEVGDQEGPTVEEYLERRDELLEECKIPAQMFTEVTTRLTSFLAPFLKSFARREQNEHAERYIRGLLSELDQKNAEAIAYLWERTVWDSSVLLAGRTGMTPLCERNWHDKSAGNWEQLMACWCSIRLVFRSPGRNR
jgi:hypothetical protein